MAQDPNNLIWLDMEMTGLDPDRDRVIEIAMVATDGALNILAESPVMVIRQPDAVLEAMDDWNKSTHGKSGLIDKVRASTTDEKAATDILLLSYLNLTSSLVLPSEQASWDQTS